MRMASRIPSFSFSSSYPKTVRPERYTLRSSDDRFRVRGRRHEPTRIKGDETIPTATKSLSFDPERDKCSSLSKPPNKGSRSAQTIIPSYSPFRHHSRGVLISIHQYSSKCEIGLLLDFPRFTN